MWIDIVVVSDARCFVTARGRMLIVRHLDILDRRTLFFRREKVGIQSCILYTTCARCRISFPKAHALEIKKIIPKPPTPVRSTHTHTQYSYIRVMTYSIVMPAYS